MAGTEKLVRTYEVEWFDSSPTGYKGDRFARVAVGHTSVGAPTEFKDIPRILQIKNGVAERDIVILHANLISTEVV